MKKYLVLSVLLAATICFLGCEDDGTSSKTKFINQSSHTVTVGPSGYESWPAFILAPGEDHSVDITDDPFFVFRPDGDVRVGKNDNLKVIFIDSYDKIIEAGS